jgi:hypothetical protein
MIFSSFHSSIFLLFSVATMTDDSMEVQLEEPVFSHSTIESDDISSGLDTKSVQASQRRRTDRGIDGTAMYIPLVGVDESIVPVSTRKRALMDLAREGTSALVHAATSAVETLSSGGGALRTIGVRAIQGMAAGVQIRPWNEPSIPIALRRSTLSISVSEPDTVSFCGGFYLDVTVLRSWITSHPVIHRPTGYGRTPLVQIGAVMCTLENVAICLLNTTETPSEILVYSIGCSRRCASTTVPITSHSRQVTR